MLSDEKYKNLTAKELLLYMLLLNRLNLSKRNSKYFHDDKGFFIYYTNRQIANDIRCATSTAVETLKNLEDVGLIHKEYQKNGLPVKIYVNDIRSQEKSAPKQPEIKPTSFDIDRALNREHITRQTFGDKKNKRRTRSSAL